MQNEAKLLAQLKLDDSKELAYKTLIKRYKENLYWHIRKIVIYHDDADDVLQNTFIKIFKNIDKFNGDSKLYTWMYRIATNESITFLNSKAKRNKVSNETLNESAIQNLVADVYFEGDEIQLKLALTFKFQTDEEVKILTIEEGLNELIPYLNNPFLSAILFTTDGEVMMKLNKKRVATITEQAPTFKNADPVLLEYLSNR